MSPEVRDFSFLKNVQTGSGLTQTPVEWVQGVNRSSVMRPGREADKSPAPSNEDKDGWSLELYFCSLHMPSWHSQGDLYSLPLLL
jgi:hypothetical protein